MIIKWCFVLCALATTKAQYYRDNPSNQLDIGQSSSDDSVNGDEIPGEAGRDYPIYNNPPRTSFDCNNQQYPGYYADPESQCQAFYICKKYGKGLAQLCPNGTIFNQEILTCDWWYNFDCSLAEQFYRVNEQVARAMEDNRQGYNYNRASSTYGAPFGNGYNGNPTYGVSRIGNRPSQTNVNNYRPSQTNRPNQNYNPPRTEAITRPPNRQYLPPNRAYLPPSREDYNRPSIEYGTPNQSRTYLPPSN